MRIENLQNENRKYAKSIGNFHVLEYVQDASVSPMNAMNEYFMSKMNVRRRQVVIDIDKDHSAVIQAGSMQWMGGNVQATSGVKGIDLDGSYVIGSEVVNPGQEILIITDKGYGKRTVIDEYRLTHRGSKGVKALNITEKNGTMVALKRIESEEHDIVIVTDNGTIMKMPLNQVSLLRRATQGVRLINLKNNELVSTVALVTKEEEDN